LTALRSSFLPAQTPFTTPTTSTTTTISVGNPVFHDAIKLWSCCPDKKCYDFDEFMAVPGCAQGVHDDGVIDI